MALSESLNKNMGDRKSRYPSKRSINLLVKEDRTKPLVRTFVLFGIYLVALALFVHFFVIGKILKLNQAESNYDQISSEVEDMRQANANYEQVRADYSHYGNSYLNAEESDMQDRMDIIALLDRDLMDQKGLINVSISGNVATLTITSDMLRNVADIVATLENEDMVSYVTVSTAASTAVDTGSAALVSSSADTAKSGTEDVVATMTINFNGKSADSETGSAGAETGVSANAEP